MVNINKLKKSMRISGIDLYLSMRRIHSSSNNHHESPAPILKTSSNLESSSVEKANKVQEEKGEKDKNQNEKASVNISKMATSPPMASIEREDEEKKLKLRVKELEQKLEAEKKNLTEKLELSEKRAAKLEIDLTQSRGATEKAIKEKDEAVKVAKDEEAKRIQNNLQELVETDLQCSVCNEVFTDASTLNCGHTFCQYCIDKWRSQKKSTCPLCRTEIKQIVEVKTLDQFVDKMYGSFMTEDGRAERTSLQEERLKLKKQNRQMLGKGSIK